MSLTTASGIASTGGSLPHDEGWALFLDFDGTLVEIVERPDAVVVEPGLPETLTRLREVLGGALALVSGRAIETLDAFLAPERFDAAGLHGIERRAGGQLFPCCPEEHPDLRRAVARLKDQVEGREGLIVEDKGCSVALHWRLAPDLTGFAQGAVQEIAAGLGPAYRIQNGKAVAEILPVRAGKGPVIELFLESTPFRGRRPIFVGDDLTDEQGFAAVNARGGVSVRVGEGPSIATHRIATPAALRDRLRQWAGAGHLAFEPVG